MKKPAETDTDANQQRLSKMLNRLFSHWELSISQQRCLLGLPQKGVDGLSKDQTGRPLVDTPEEQERAILLLAIHKSLRLLFPQNRELAYSWIKQPNRAFEGVSPINLIEKEGMPGLYLVHDYLNHMLYPSS